jgi:hypothetical protein
MPACHCLQACGGFDRSGPDLIPFDPERASPGGRLIFLYGVSFHTYKKVSSLAVATLRSPFRVARFNADRTFSLLSVNCANGTLSATPNWSRSIREDLGHNRFVLSIPTLRNILLRHGLEIHLRRFLTTHRIPLSADAQTLN